MENTENRLYVFETKRTDAKQIIGDFGGLWRVEVYKRKGPSTEAKEFVRYDIQDVPYEEAAARANELRREQEED